MDRELNLFPLEWKMMKLQLRYFGHEVRVKPDRVRRLPHNMLFRGHVDGKPRVRGRGEQAYPATIRRALERCGLEQTQWVQLALDRKEWKDFIEKRAMIAFMQGWEEKEEVQKEQRQRDELVRADRELTRTRLITDGREDDQHEQFGDHRIEGDSTEVMTEEGDDGAESEEYVGMSDSEDEGEEEHREVWGGHRRVQMGDIQVGQRENIGISYDENGRVNDRSDGNVEDGVVGNDVNFEIEAEEFLEAENIGMIEGELLGANMVFSQTNVEAARVHFINETDPETYEDMNQRQEEQLEEEDDMPIEEQYDHQQSTGAKRRKEKMNKRLRERRKLRKKYNGLGN
jgi:hypothetical protein